MGLFSNKEKGKPPHTWYPDILHWQVGDEIYCWGVISAFGLRNFSIANYNKYLVPYTGTTQGTFLYKSVDKRGNIFLEDENGNIVQFEFWRFIRKARNESLGSRKQRQEMKESEEYMKLMHEFQKAFNELQESDSHPKRLGEPEARENKAAKSSASEKK